MLLECSTPNFEIKITESADQQLAITLWERYPNQSNKKILEGLPLEILEKSSYGSNLRQDLFLKLGGNKFSISLSKQHNYPFMGLMHFRGHHILWFKSCSNNHLL